MACRIHYTKETLQYLLHPDTNPGSLLQRQVESMTYANMHWELGFRTWNLPASSEYSVVCTYSRRTAELKEVGLHFRCCIALSYGLYCTEMVCSALPPGFVELVQPSLGPTSLAGSHQLWFGPAPHPEFKIPPPSFLSLSSLGIVRERTACPVSWEKGAPCLLPFPEGLEGKRKTHTPLSAFKVQLICFSKTKKKLLHCSGILRNSITFTK